MEHELKTTHGAQTRLGCGKAISRHDYPTGGGEGGGSSGGGEGENGGCNCVAATDEEVRAAVEAALINN